MQKFGSGFLQGRREEGLGGRFCICSLLSLLTFLVFFKGGGGGGDIRFTSTGKEKEMDD